MQVYQQALFLAEIAWFDTRKLAEHKTTVSLADFHFELDQFDHLD